MASFVERNKAWVLPLLGAGVLAVVILNVRGNSPPPAGPESPAQTAAEMPAATAGAGPAPPTAVPESGADLWSDLRALETLPAAIAGEDALRNRAYQSLGSAMNPPRVPELPFPTAPLPPSKPAAGKDLVPATLEPAPPPPEPEFVIQGPRGRKVWLNGKPFREGEHVGEGPYRIGRIGRSKVEIQGPQGSLTRSTIPAPRPGSQASKETP